jgi:hypothetical protein
MPLSSVARELTAKIQALQYIKKAKHQKKVQFSAPVNLLCPNQSPKKASARP